MATTQQTAAQIVTQLAQAYAASHREVGSLTDRASMTVAGRPSRTTRATVGGSGDPASAGMTGLRSSLLSEAVAAGTASSNGQVPYTTYNSQFPIAPASHAAVTELGKTSGGLGSAGRLGGGGSASFGGGGEPATGAGFSAGDAAMTAAVVAGPVAAKAAVAGGGALGGMPFMPFMPFGGAGQNSGQDSGRRVPGWLVETEDVWGESTPVAPGVIGEEPQGGPLRR